MPQIRSSDLRQLHSLMMQAQRQNPGYEVWADTLFMQVFRSKHTDSKAEYTKGDKDANGAIIFKPMDSEDDL